MHKPSELLERIRRTKPLVHHLTNWVTIYECANITRALGALPVMAHAAEEVEQMVGIAQSLVLNIGTLTPGFIDAMLLAGRAAGEAGTPITLDAVGAGATGLRTDKCLELLGELRITVVKGNASEIGVLAGARAETRGVESGALDGDPAALAAGLARERGLVAVVTGAEDIVSDGRTTYLVRNGCAMMGSVVGTGCMAASVIGAFLAVADDPASAAASALAAFGAAGELAAENSQGPGSFGPALFDAVFALEPGRLDSMSRIETL